MNLLNSKIIYLDNPDPYDENNVRIETKDIGTLSKEDKVEIIKYLLSYGILPEINNLLNKFDYFRREQIKEEKGINFSDKDTVFYLNKYNQLAALTDYNIEDFIKYNKNGIYAAINIDTNKYKKYQEKIQQVKAKYEEKLKKQKERKKYLEIKKAERVLAKYSA